MSSDNIYRPRNTALPPTMPLEQNEFVAPSEQPRQFTNEFIKSRSQWMRPDKSIMIASRDSAAKLSALGFDPIETMVRKYDEIQAVIDQIMMSSKPSMIAMAQMMALQQKISNDLMKYGYAPVPVNAAPEEDKTPTRIIYSGDDE
jgi:hypothetical protein